MNEKINNNGFILTDIADLTLSPEDREIIEHPAIFGILLFTRNYETPQQLKELTKNIRQINPSLVIAVDQEGGRVQRFREGFTDLKAMSYWGQVFDRDPEAALEGLAKQTQVMVTELQQCGVQISLAPVLDIDYQVSEVIGERSFHRNPDVVAQLAACAINTMHHYKMPSIGKHFPGHGAVAVDSHLDLPLDHRTFEEIWNEDIKPYRELINKLDAIMPAHITYSAIDDFPAGFSPRWMREILIKRLNFQGIIISDDLTMKGAAVLGDYQQRATLALEAGCDIITVCNYRDGLVQILDHYGNYKNKVSHEKIKNYVQFLM